MEYSILSIAMMEISSGIRYPSFWSAIYLVKTNPAFPSILQNAWDEILKDSNVMLILSGSLIGMMQKYALSYNSPLYGRRTLQMRLDPLLFTDVYEVQKLPFDKATEQYAVTGGVPKYLEFFEDARDLKYHAKPVDAPVYFGLKEKVSNAAEIKKAFPGYQVIYGICSKSGYTQRLLDTARDNTSLLLINEDHLSE